MMSKTISIQTRIVIFLFLSLIFGVRSNVIDTIPSLPNNTLANGYFNLIVKTQFTRPSQTCGWYYQGNRIEPDFWSSGESGVACNSKQFPSNDRKYNISCNDLGNELASNFTILGNINKGTLNASVYCSGSPLLTLPIITVQDCTPTLPYSVTVKATTYQFNDNGTFSCPSNTALFTSNGNMLPTNQTTCQATAKWENEGFVQCWTAPTVTLNGDLNVMEGMNLTLNCNYDDVTPVGNSSIFYVGNVSYIKPKIETLVLTLQQIVDNTAVSCQAVTPYTMKPDFNNTGRSDPQIIHIMYVPYQEIQTVCTWIVNQTESCQVDFFSNQQAEYVSLTVNERVATNDGPNYVIATNDKQTFYFTRKLVTFDDVGNYTLVVTSVAFPSKFSILFDIDVVDHCSSISATDIYIVAGCAAVVIVILIVTNTIFCMRSKRNSKGQPGNIELNQQSTRNHIPTYDVVGPATATGEAPYETDLTTISANLASRNTSYANTGFEEDKDGYLAVNGHNSRVHTSNVSAGSAISSAAVSLPTDKYGYIDLNNQTTDTTSEYEIMDSRQPERK